MKKWGGGGVGSSVRDLLWMWRSRAGWSCANSNWRENALLSIDGTIVDLTRNSHSSVMKLER